jgi:anti-sigma regulatory factor (Ser/Thr protein kinase)
MRGGDLFFLFEKDRNYFFVIAEVMGSGFSVSYTSALLYMSIRNAMDYLLDYNIPQFLKSVNQDLFELSTTHYVNMLAGSIDTSYKKLSFISAGQHPPRVFYRDGRIEDFKVEQWGAPLGMNYIENPQSAYREYTLDLRQVNKIGFYTDGLVEVAHSRGADIDYSCVDCVLLENSHKGIETFLEKCRHEEEKDDATLFVVNLKPPFKEDIYLGQGVNIDLLTEQFMGVMRDFDFSNKDVGRGFVVLQEMLSNIVKYGKKGKVRCYADHEKVRLIFKSDGPGFQLDSVLNWVRDNMYRNESFPEALLKCSGMNSTNLGLYMTMENADYFKATSDGKVLGVTIRRTPSQVEYVVPED